MARAALRRGARRAVALLLAAACAQPTSLWADPSPSKFLWRTPSAAAADDAASAGPDLAAPAASDASTMPLGAAPNGQSGKLRWRQYPAEKPHPAEKPPSADKKPSAAARPRISAASEASSAAASAGATPADTIKLAPPNADAGKPEPVILQPAKPESVKSEPPAERTASESPLAGDRIGAASAPGPAAPRAAAPRRSAAAAADAEVIRWTIEARPIAAPGDGEIGRTGAALAADAEFPRGESTPSETRLRIGSQAIDLGEETRVRFAVEESGEATLAFPTRDRYAVRQAGDESIAQQPADRRRDPFSDELFSPEPAPSAALDPSTGSLPPADTRPPGEFRPGDAMTPGPGPDASQPTTPFSTPIPEFSPLAPPGDLGGQTAPGEFGINPPPGPSPLAEASPCQGDRTGCSSALEKLQANTIDHIALDIRVTGAEGRDFPCECTFGDQKFAERQWALTNYTWKANCQCHKPMYFEDVQLERYGHSWNPILQPVLSGAHFYLNVLLLPYHMGIYAPTECIYTLGYYRPGSCAPYVIEPFPWSAKGLLFESSAIFTGAWVWGFFAH